MAHTKVKRINFILPALSPRPGGGTKIMYEYANRFAQLGYDVTVIHSIRRPFKKAKTPIWIRHILTRLRKKQTWFIFSPQVKSLLVKEITDKNVPDADVVISTWWQMAYAVAALSDCKGKKFNFIQDYEIWAGQKEKVHESYSLKIQPIVIAKYLAVLVSEIGGVDTIHIPNAIDTTIFKIRIPVSERPPASVIMLYSKEPRKASHHGIEALIKVKEKIPSLSVTLFSTFDRPETLPAWISFYQQPSNLASLYNDHAIFVSPSLGEGWALPPAEAMACGCAVVCTNIGGHRDYTTDHETALLVEPGDSTQLTTSIIKLIEADDLRNKVATKGSINISSQFSWSASMDKMEGVLFGKIK